MPKFLVALICALALCWGGYSFYPGITQVAFHLPPFIRGTAVPGGGAGITWTMLVGGVFFLGAWRIVSAKR